MTTFLCFVPEALAGLMEQMVDLPTCTLHLRVIKESAKAAGPRFIMMDGVPLSGAVFQHLAERLSERLNATSTLIDFPGVGSSTLKGQNYGWSPLRECLRSYLAIQPPFILVLGDLGLPVVAPLFPELPNLRGAVIFNSVVKPSELHPPFPLNFLRSSPRLAVAVGSITPRFIFEKRIRDLGLGRPETVSREEIGALCAEMRQNHGFRRLARVMNDIELNEETDRAILSGLATTIPQLFIWGEADPVLGFEYKKLPPLSDHQRLIVFPQARHFLMIDFAEEVTDVIAKWYATFP
ncbi:MAG: alpha/beta hydrolase [Gammaproteobacteria bacterium]|nr:alpha/beta hydrolase [Gammaproteobacteria bacterium]